MPSSFTYNLVAQYNTPSYYHKTFENKLIKLEKFSRKNRFCTQWVNCRISKKIEKIIFLVEHIQVFIYLYGKSSHALQIRHSVWVFTILIGHLLTNNFADWWWGQLKHWLWGFCVFSSTWIQSENSIIELPCTLNLICKGKQSIWLPRTIV